MLTACTADMYDLRIRFVYFKLFREYFMRRYIILDFDKTLTIKHTFFTRENGRDLSDEDKLKNLRNPDFMRAFIRKADAEGAVILIITGHDEPLHVASYVGTLLGDDTIKKLDDDKEKKSMVLGKMQTKYAYYYNPNKPVQLILSATKQYDIAPGKNYDIECALKFLNCPENFPKKDIVVVEDTKANYDAALSAGYTAIFAEEGKDDYLQQLKALYPAPVSKPDQATADAVARFGINASNSHPLSPAAQNASPSDALSSAATAAKESAPSEAPSSATKKSSPSDAPSPAAQKASSTDEPEHPFFAAFRRLGASVDSTYRPFSPASKPAAPSSNVVPKTPFLRPSV